MPTYYRVTDMLSVAPQISAADLAHYAEAGFGTIINNRPDGEEADQVTASELARAAAQHGLEYIELPVVMQTVSDSDIAAFGQALANAPKPVLAFCRSGTRSISMWALSQAPNIAAVEILDIAKASGYDLLPLLSRIQALQS